VIVLDRCKAGAVLGGGQGAPRPQGTDLTVFALTRDRP